MCRLWLVFWLGVGLGLGGESGSELGGEEWVVELGSDSGSELEGGSEGGWRVRVVGDGGGGLPPLPSLADSPVRYLRRLLGVSEERRGELLGLRSEGERVFWLRKVGEYEGLGVVEREGRLRTAELHWYLALLIRLPRGVREVRLGEVPEGDRVLVGERLAVWDGLPGDLRADILANFRVLQYFARLVSGSGGVGSGLLGLSGSGGGSLGEGGGSGWDLLAPRRRQELFGEYVRFFGLSRLRQEEAVRRVPFPEVRSVLRERVDALSGLSDGERERCLAALDVFVGMSAEERLAFRESAARWRGMGLREREFWSRFVSVLGVGGSGD